MQTGWSQKWLVALLRNQLVAKQTGRSHGFTLTDVMVAIFVLTSLTVLSMSTLSNAMLLKVRSRATTEATNWIQQDLENVKNSAVQLSYTLASSAAIGQPDITLATNPVVTNPGLSVGEYISIGTDSTIYVIQSVSSNSIRLTRNMVSTQAAGSVVIPISKCNATTSTAGLAQVLGQNLPTLAGGGSRTISNRAYTLTRQTGIQATAPFDVLQVTYSVAQQGSSTPLTRMYTEVIPNVSYQCPKTR